MAACPFLNSVKALLSVFFLLTIHLSYSSLSVSILPLHPFCSLSLPPVHASLSLSFSIVLKGPRTNYQKGHFHLWTAGFNRYLFHAFKINPILLLSVWFVYFALEYSFSRKGGNARDAIHLEPPLYWISLLADQACKKDISSALK